MTRPVHLQFLDKIGQYKLFNYFIAAVCIIEITLYFTSLIMNMMCHQALPIAIYNVVVQVMALAMAILCIVAVSYFKYFNTILGYSIVVLSCKLIQLIIMLIFSHEGTCYISGQLRITLGLLTTLQGGCLVISTWILKRVRKVDRQMKVQGFIKNKQFLSD